MKKESLSVITIKTLLAVVIFTGIGTIIIGGGYLIGDYYKNKSGDQSIKRVVQEVTITTDKIEYDLKEYTIKVTIKNNSNKTIVYQAPYICADASLGLEKFVDNNWKSDSFPSAWCVAKNKTLNSGSTITIAVELDHSEEYQKSGMYRILFKYFGKVVYSNEFTIKEKLDEKATIEKVGRVRVVGNEPFTNLVLEVEGDKTYCLIGPKFDELWNLQGKDIIVKGNIDKKHGCLIGKTIFVTSFIIKEKVKDETADWKTYRNEEYGFEFEYPEDWLIKYENEKIHFCNPLSKSDVGISGFSIEFKNKNYLQAMSRYIFIGKDTEERITKIGGVDGRDIVTKENKLFDGSYRTIYLLRNDKTYILNIKAEKSFAEFREISNIKNENIEGIENLKVFEKVLLTFKFIEK